MKRTTVSARTLVLAPRGRDAALAVAILNEAGIEAEACASLASLIDELNRGAAVAVITEDALATADLRPIADWIADQQPWSDLPFVLLTSHGGGLERNPAARRYLDLLGNATFVERPFHPTTLISQVRSALRGRKRQYEARARMAALHESERRYRTLFETIDEGFCLIEFLDGPEGPLSDYVHIDANPAYERHAGIEGIVGKRLREIVSPSEADAWADIYRRVLVTGESIRFERELAETGRHLELAAFRVEPAERRHVAVLFQDVSPRNRAQAELRRSEAQLRELNERLEARVAEGLAERRLLATIVETTDALVQVLDSDYRFLAINSACAASYERIYGWRPAIGQSLIDLLADRPDQMEAAKSVWSRALAGETFTQIGEFGDPKFESRYYEMKFEALRGSDGRQTGAFLTGTDITERVREQRRLAEAEAARREADALYRAYFENTLEALFIIGVEPDGGFIVEEINPAHEAGVGLKLEDIRGKRVEDILPADIAERVRETYRHVVETGRVLQYRERFDLTGEPQHWDTSLVPMRDQDGRIFRLIGSSRNVTRQVVAEEALRQSQKMESMGQLTGGVAHDFNNLLTPIVAALDLLQRRGVGGEREQRLIAGAAQSAERAKVLVQRLLAFARRQPLQPVPVDVAQLVDGMKALVASTTGPQIALVVEVAGDVPPAMADPNQLEMALLNLAVNARDAMPHGGTLRIAASAHRVKAGEDAKLAPGRYVRVAVADTGTGMDAETLARAVEPFFSTKGIGKGTGLGLSMVHGLASQLGGALDITSAPGAGTTIELWLPQAADAPEAQAPAHEAAPAPAQDAALQNTALLVDDEEFVRMSTADMLGDLGYRVVEAASAEEALEMISNGGRIDLVVTDHLMPGMTGTELARSVHVSWPDLPVLVVSGYSEVDGIASDLPRLTKPFRKDDLAASLAGLTTPRAS